MRCSLHRHRKGTDTMNDNDTMNDDDTMIDDAKKQTLLP